MAEAMAPWTVPAPRSCYGEGMNEAAALIDPFLRGIGVGGTLVIAFAVWRSRVGRDVRIAGLLMGLGAAAWLITESMPLWRAFGLAYPLVLLAYPTAGLFWLFIVTTFEDRKLDSATLSPSLLLLVSGVAMQWSPHPAADVIWSLRNIAGGLLALHAGAILLRGWRDDLLEARRRLRAPILGLCAVYALLEMFVAFAHRLDPAGPWLALAVGELWGGLIITVLILGLALVFLQARPEVFGAARRGEAAPDPRVEAADRLALKKLAALMSAEAWRREGLTIGDLAAELELPEHRLRRLINQRLGHRNFADFLNGQRIEAAKRRLADPAEARTTVAAIAFDLGFGSLGPFNRAFRAATGITPTDWRKRALADGSPIPQDSV
jgi:AraC-like DNA-binding protein